MIKNYTAYQINGEYFLHDGKPNAKTKKKITEQIKKNKERIQNGYFETKINFKSFVKNW